MDVEGLGDKLVEQLVSQQLVVGYRDLYRLEQSQLMALERMGKKSAEKLIAALLASKSRGLARLLNALSIRHVGTRVATIIAQHFGSMEKLQQASVDELNAIDEVGPIIAESVFQYVRSPEGVATLAELKEVGVLMELPQASSETVEQVLEGKTLVVTGTLTKFTRDSIQELIIRLGGRAASSVSSKTDFVVAGDNAGSKLAKARQLGIQVLSEAEFEQLTAAAPNEE